MSAGAGAQDSPLPGLGQGWLPQGWESPCPPTLFHVSVGQTWEGAEDSMLAPGPGSPAGHPQLTCLPHCHSGWAHFLRPAPCTPSHCVALCRGSRPPMRWAWGVQQGEPPTPLGVPTTPQHPPHLVLKASENGQVCPHQGDPLLCTPYLPPRGLIKKLF